jgi:hypothetical protein
MLAFALAGLGATAALAARSARLVRDGGSALAMASERLEALRVGPRSSGADTGAAPGGTVLARRWLVQDGRGNPSVLDTRVLWAEGTIDLVTEALP